jgi:EmrB/QacA subfamily drug resistance transporter
MVSLVLALVPLQLDALVTATAVPTIVGELGGFSRIAWVATAYLLTFAIGTLLSGRIGDMLGRKPLYLAAASVFLAGSAWSGLSTTMAEFIVARALQGLGAGMMATTILAIVADVVPPESRARYQGLLAAVMPVSMIAGPALGGVITDHLGWRWIFLLNLPLIAVSIGVGAFVLRLPKRPSAGGLDLAGAVLSTIGAAGLVLAATWGGQYGWGSARVLATAVIGVGAFVALAAVERRTVHPVLPPGLFRDRTVLMCLLIMFCGAGAVMMAATNFVPVFQQLVQHLSASSSGLLLLPLLLPAIVMAIASGQFLSRRPWYRAVLIAGASVLAVGCLLLATMTVATPVWLACCYLVVFGTGLGLLFQTPMVLVQDTAPVDQLGAATGTASFLRMIGGALGVGALGSLFTARVHESLARASAPGLDASALSSLSPDRVAGLSDAQSAALAHAVSSGSSALFWVATMIAVVAVLAALAVPAGRRSAQIKEAEAVVR